MDSKSDGIILKKINLSNAKPQDYSMSSPTIVYITENADLKTSEKLSKCCKAFKRLQKKNKSNIQTFNASFGEGSIRIAFDDDSRKYTSDSEWILKMLNQETIPFGRIKIMNSIKLFCVARPFLTMVLKHLDLSLTKDSIEIVTHDILDYTTLRQIMQPKVKNFNFTFSTKDVKNPLSLAFQRLENASTIYFNWVHLFDALITPTIFQALFKIQRKVKLQECTLATLIDIDAEDVIRFCDMFMDVNGTLILRFSKYDQRYHVFKDRLTDLVADRICQRLAQIRTEQGYTKLH
uniref:DUF38 domain-containing protein n=1 Tax=Panagrolaimus superbus TaxID=310955 RepID=A0A914XXQ4_9BILA